MAMQKYEQIKFNTKNYDQCEEAGGNAKCVSILASYH